MLLAPLRTTLGLLALTPPLVLATSCASTKASASGDAEVTSTEWVEAAPDLQLQIDTRAMQVAVMASPDEFVELSDWFQGVGEPAYPALLEMIESGEKRERSFALSVVSATADRRLLEPVKEAMPVSALKDEQHSYEYARALARMGDYSELPTLIAGLQDKDRYTRALANETLKEVTNNQIGYSPDASAEERQKAVEAWLAWWEAQQQDVLLQSEED